jgi:anti-sigma-K factor RskA
MQTNFRSIVLATAALAVAALTIQTARAETTRVKIPFSFVAAGKSLPAGEYIVERNANTNFLSLQAQSTGQTILFVVSPTGDGGKTVSLCCPSGSILS